MPDRQLISGESQAEDLQFEAGLRPRRLADFTGQTKLKENLGIAIEAARMRGEAMDHVLLYGPPGLGKTTLASIIGEELEVAFTSTSGPVLQKKLDLTGILSNIRAQTEGAQSTCVRAASQGTCCGRCGRGGCAGGSHADAGSRGDRRAVGDR